MLIEKRMEIIGVAIFISLVTTPIQSRKLKEDPYLTHKRRQLECIEETRVDTDLVIKVKHGDWQLNPNPLLKKWVLCSLMKNGLMTAEGVYKIDVALSKVPKRDAKFVESIIDKCLSQKAIPADDIAYNFARCYFKNKGNNTIVSIV